MTSFALSARKIVLAFVLLFLALVFIYLPALPSSLFSTDDAALIEIPQIQSGLDPAAIRSVFTYVDANIDYYPVRDLSYMLDKSVGRGSWVFARAHQLTLLAIASILLFLIWRELGVSPGVALAFVSIWIVHPYHAELLMWLSARKDLLAILFSLASVYAFLVASRNQRGALFALSIGFFALGLLSKVSFTLLPFIGLLAWFFSMPALGSRKAKATAALGAILAISAGAFQSWFYTHVNDMRNIMPLGDRLRLASIALARMTLGWFLPAMNVVDQDNFGEWPVLYQNYILIGALIAAGVVAFFIFCLRRRDKPSMVLLFAAVGLYLPISGLGFPHMYFYSTRYFEPAGLALFTLITVKLGHGQNFRRSALALWFAGFAFFGFSAWREGRVWADAISVRQKAVIFEPKSISNRAYWLGDLLALPSSQLTAEQIDLRDRLAAELRTTCGALPETDASFANCYQTFRRLSAGRESSERYFELYVKARSKLRPLPKSIARLRYEMSLRNDLATRENAQVWLATNTYSPDPEYRLLKLVSECLVGGVDSSARRKREAFEAARLLSKPDENEFLADILGPRTRVLAKSCLF